MNKQNIPQQIVAWEQHWIVVWSLLHIVTVLCLVLGIYFCRDYMLLPDRVIIMDDAGNLYYGTSGKVICTATANDIASRAAVAFLERSFEQDHQKACEAIFGRSAQKSLSGIVSETKEEFNGQKIRQFPVIEKIELIPATEPDQCLAFVSGTLHRTGIYLNLPYYQKLGFNLGLRLMRSPDIKTYPLRVLRMRYEERSIFDNKKEKEK